MTPSHHFSSDMQPPLVGHRVSPGGHVSHLQEQSLVLTRRNPVLQGGHFLGLHWDIPPRTQVHSEQSSVSY